MQIIATLTRIGLSRGADRQLPVFQRKSTKFDASAIITRSASSGTHVNFRKISERIFRAMVPTRENPVVAG